MVRCDYSVFAEVMFVMNFNASSEKDHRVFFLAARMVGLVEDIVLSDFLTSSNLQTYQGYTRAPMFLLQFPNIIKIIEMIEMEVTVSWTVDISDLDNENLFSSWIEDGLLPVLAENEYVRNSMEDHEFRALSFYER